MRNVKIWAVDDDPALLFLININLREVDSSAKLTTFPDGKAAIDFIVANADNEQMLPDIILLDINMPVMDGWDFLDAYSPLHSQVAKKIRIYILSSSISESDMDKANRNPLVSRFVSKPIPESLLEEFLNAVKTEPHPSTV